MAGRGSYCTGRSGGMRGGYIARGGRGGRVEGGDGVRSVGRAERRPRVRGPPPATRVPTDPATRAGDAAAARGAGVSWVAWPRAAGRM